MADGRARQLGSARHAMTQGRASCLRQVASDIARTSNSCFQGPHEVHVCAESLLRPMTASSSQAVAAATSHERQQSLHSGYSAAARAATTQRWSTLKRSALAADPARAPSLRSSAMQARSDRPSRWCSLPRRQDQCAAQSLRSEPQPLARDQASPANSASQMTGSCWTPPAPTESTP